MINISYYKCCETSHWSSFIYCNPLLKKINIFNRQSEDFEDDAEQWSLICIFCEVTSCHIRTLIIKLTKL
jgi:hypothetical protein